MFEVSGQIVILIKPFSYNKTTRAFHGSCTKTTDKMFINYSSYNNYISSSA